jgi:hypothetical protein
MKSIIPLLFVFLILTGNPSYAQESEPIDSLMLDVPFISVRVDSLAAGLVEEGITQTILGDTILFHLQTAGIEVVNSDSILSVSGAPTLVLHVEAILEEGIDQVCYSIRLEFAQTVRLMRDENIIAWRVPTWSEGSIGLYTRRWQDELIKDVLRHTESFIEAYLEANPREDE